LNDCICGVDRLRDRAVDLLDLEERQIESGSFFDVADPVDAKDLPVLSADLLQQIDRHHHLAIEPGLELEPLGPPDRELLGDVAVGHQVALVDQPAGADPRVVGMARQLDAPARARRSPPRAASSRYWCRPGPGTRDPPGLA
jgi:hypothetical protein